MLQSMTGFASTSFTLTTQHGSSPVTMWVKSVNARYFESQSKMPLQLGTIEHEAIKLFKKKLHRGTIMLWLQLGNPGIFTGAIIADVKAAKQYENAVQELKKHTSITDDFSLSDLVRQEGIFVIEEHLLEDAAKQQLLAKVDGLIEQLILMRMQEGKVLFDDLNQRVKSIKRSMHAIKEAAAQLMVARKKEIGSRLQDLEKQRENVTSQLIETQRASLYYELDKIDIHEELVRFESHLSNFNNQLISKAEEKGRRLDFILQELAREINTIAAKCSDATISAHAIDIKVEIEKAREQVQNVV